MGNVNQYILTNIPLTMVTYPDRNLYHGGKKGKEVVQASFPILGTTEILVLMEDITNLY